ncbi:RDD family protein [Streptomyces zagrosensis]|uniref:RDD family protein n=1 Tax=Streptomyces zagrosensis TaxID=1042984 RepID=UPI001FEC7518|nr:RDD family protein [Streptomyces zagrosensis]
MYPTKPGREHPADLPRRLSAYVIDVVVFCGLFSLAVALDMQLSCNGAIGAPCFIAMCAGYSPLATARWGGTVGKRLCGLRVARAWDGTPLSYEHALCRHLAHLGLWFFGALNHLWYLWDNPLQQCLHDKLADTVVVQREAQREAADY